MRFWPSWLPKQEPTYTAAHTGPICKECGIEFYYDFIPERHDGSGYCWICFGERPLPPSHSETP